jgi:hypothetical protein
MKIVNYVKRKYGKFGPTRDQKQKTDFLVSAPGCLRKEVGKEPIPVVSSFATPLDDGGRSS